MFEHRQFISNRRWLTRDYSEPVAFITVLSLFGIALFGAIGVIMFMTCGGILALMNWRRNFSSLIRFSFLLAFPLAAILSTVWSDAPHETMRAGLQLLLTFVISIVVCTNLRPRKLLLAFCLGAFALCCSAAPNIRWAIEARQPLTSSYLGSKNQLGFSAFLLFTSALAIVADRGQGRAFRLAALIAIPIGLSFAYYSRSGGATVSILLSVLLFPPFAVLTLLNLRARIVLSSLAVTGFAFALLFREDVDELTSRFRSDVLAKNETLTGRTYLWHFADRLWRERPLIGHGYSAFWRHGNLDAEALWKWGGIRARSGFNFHSIISETKVDLGTVGVVLLLVTCTVVILAAIWRQLNAPSIPGAFMLSTLLVLYVRSTIENGLVAQFSSLTLLLIGTGVYSFKRTSQTVSTSSDRRTGAATQWRSRDQKVRA